MAKTTMFQQVRLSTGGEITTLAKLCEQGRIRFTTCLMDTPKRAGERKTVRRYFADLIECEDGKGGSSGWEISQVM